MIPTSSHGQSGCPKQNRYYHHAPPSPSSKLRSTICRSLPLKTHGFQSFFPRPFFADGSKPGAHLADRVRDWCSGQHAPTACTGATSQGGLWHSNSCHPDAWNKRRIHLYVYIYIILLYICIWVCDIYYTSSNLWCTKVICIEYIYIYIQIILWLDVNLVYHNMFGKQTPTHSGFDLLLCLLIESTISSCSFQRSRSKQFVISGRREQIPKMPYLPKNLKKLPVFSCVYVFFPNIRRRG